MDKAPQHIYFILGALPLAKSWNTEAGMLHCRLSLWYFLISVNRLIVTRSVCGVRPSSNNLQSGLFTNDKPTLQFEELPFGYTAFEVVIHILFSAMLFMDKVWLNT